MKSKKELERERNQAIIYIIVFGLIMIALFLIIILYHNPKIVSCQKELNQTKDNFQISDYMQTYMDEFCKDNGYSEYAHKGYFEWGYCFRNQDGKYKEVYMDWQKVLYGEDKGKFIIVNARLEQ